MLLSIITPTFNEAKNVKKFVGLIESSLNNFSYEIIFVDDNSTDKTYEVVKKLASKKKHIRCIRRIGRRGLSSAVIEGCLASSSDLLIVMDSDLQHDEKKIPLMISLLRERKLDVVIASRFLRKKNTFGLSKFRNLLSRIANFLANKISNANLTDPMSGFFLIKRSVFDKIAPNLSGLGFKILLDIFSASKEKILYQEISFNFKKRLHGESKLDSLVLWEYLLLLWQSKFGKFIPARFLSFCLIGGSGVFVHIIALFFFINIKLDFLYAQSISTIVAMTSNFFLNNMLTYRDRRKKGFAAFKALIIFYLTCGIGASANIGISNLLYVGNISGISGIWYLSGLIGAIVGSVWNFLMSSLITWKEK
jgi:dolichol-phosphate mannosyltransferase